ncbi:hypothetical protein YB2330_003359 [Saitoella coloradoensis]
MSSTGHRPHPLRAYIRLTPLGPSDHAPRTITLHPNKRIFIGRSSVDPRKGRLPAQDTLWFDSAVLSRTHACIEFDGASVKVWDFGSSHGTWLQTGFGTPGWSDLDVGGGKGQKVPGEGFGLLLLRGSKITFGNDIEKDGVTHEAVKCIANVLIRGPDTPYPSYRGIYNYYSADEAFSRQDISAAMHPDASDFLSKQMHVGILRQSPWIQSADVGYFPTTEYVAKVLERVALPKPQDRLNLSVKNLEKLMLFKFQSIVTSQLHTQKPAPTRAALDICSLITLGTPQPPISPDEFKRLVQLWARVVYVINTIGKPESPTSPATDFKPFVLQRFEIKYLCEEDRELPITEFRDKIFDLANGMGFMNDVARNPDILGYAGQGRAIQGTFTEAMREICGEAYARLRESREVERRGRALGRFVTPEDELVDHRGDEGSQYRPISPSTEQSSGAGAGALSPGYSPPTPQHEFVGERPLLPMDEFVDPRDVGGVVDRRTAEQDEMNVEYEGEGGFSETDVEVGGVIVIEDETPIAPDMEVESEVARNIIVVDDEDESDFDEEEERVRMEEYDEYERELERERTRTDESEDELSSSSSEESDGLDGLSSSSSEESSSEDESESDEEADEEQTRRDAIYRGTLLAMLECRECRERPGELARQRIEAAFLAPGAAPRTEPVLQPPPDTFMMEQYLEARRKLLQVEKELENANQKLGETHIQQGVKRKREDDEEEEVPVPRAVEVTPIVNNDAMVIDDEPVEPAKKKARFGYVASALGGVVLGGVAMFAGLVASAAGN